MERRNTPGIVLTLLLISMLTLAFDIQPVQTESSAYTRTNFFEQQVLALVNGSRAYDCALGLEDIALRYHAFRAGGSAGANETAYWIKKRFESFGLENWLEPYQFTNWTLLSEPFLVIDDDGNRNTTHDQFVIDSFQSTHLSWPTLEGDVFADLVVLPLPEAADDSQIGVHPINETAWDAVNTTGKTILVGREVRWDYSWEQTYKTKLREQTPAAVIYTWWYDWMSFTPPVLSSAGGRPPSSLGSYYWDLRIPVGFVGYEEGIWIRGRENTADVAALVSIESVIGAGTHYNVVGKIGGYQDPERVVIISGHYDTVMCGGFCDNGAGTAGVIELANVFADAVRNDYYKPRYTLLFVAFADEELGLVGSINYVKRHKTEMANITAVVNLDCIGSDEFYVAETVPVDGFDLDEVVLNAAQDLAINATLETLGRSDHESFQNPSRANDFYSWSWGLEAGISDAIPVESSTMLVSLPLVYRDKWSMGEPGWIHTSFDNSTSTETLTWVEAEDLTEHIKVAALSIMRISPPAGVGWHLDVHVTDSIGQDVPSANVTATYPNATVAESKLTDANGWARLTLMETIINATGEYPVGNYTVEATYKNYSVYTTVNMTEDKQTTLILEDFVIPEFPSLITLTLIVTATLLLVVIYRRKLST